MASNDKDSSKKKKLRLGEQLIENGLITEEKLAQALEEQKSTGESLGEILIKNNIIEEKQLYKVLAEQLDVKFLELFDIKIPPNLVLLLPERIVKTYNVVPIKVENDILTLAMINPKDTFAIDEVRVATGLSVKPVLSSKIQIAEVIRSYYGGDDISEALKLVKDEVEVEGITQLSKKDLEIELLKQSAEEAPIIKLVNAVINDAVGNRASDIHIEPTESDCRIRFRIDGVLYDVTHISLDSYRAVISRIKIIGDIDIAEKRVPQDGSCTVVVKEKNIDIRISTFPTINGEKVVMRLLVREDVIFSLEKLGFEGEDLKKFNSLIECTAGIILVVGPTGCGKTTTLYSALTQLNSQRQNIVTIEDPVEYAIPGIAQSQINLKAGFNFANSIRSIMRQDPDIILVGEIRDLETAELAIRASLTGHLVFSTLHTRDSLEAVTRLVDMGIEPFLIACSLIGVLAQRLVRKVCPRCREITASIPAVLDKFRDIMERLNLKESDCTFYRPKGCDFCSNTGFRGRDGIFELLIISSEEMRTVITKGGSKSELRNLAMQQGFHSLKEKGFKKAAQGITTLSEVLLISN
ncbi:MAG: GspE/PulE family protein [Candidatus Omnitrophota bacterium]